ncbi:translation initiation factor IF-3 [Candidatus Gracilibacteria bacterium]|nr:translation initiation factor IF-3 [Candidatus Gracilibacteria bacterium]MCF7898658.1 translation initiation factor IF-3 [Candidatus Paceibacterota bacterium]
MAQKININNNIRSLKLRVIGHNGENLGVLTKDESLAKAKALGLDLIEVSPHADPPVARIADYGKYTYETSKKLKEVKSKAHSTETKTVQISVSISDNDLMMKARKTAEWINEGHRVKIDLQLKGRTKYMDEKFLRERMNRILAIVPADYKIAEPLKKVPKSMMVVLEKSK